MCTYERNEISDYQQLNEILHGQLRAIAHGFQEVVLRVELPANTPRIVYS